MRGAIPLVLLAVTNRILIVDDEVNQRRALAIGLKLEGFEVIEASDGHDALAQLALACADVAIVDVMMPGMNGLDLARRMASAHPTVQVVLTSAYHLSARQLERAGVRAVAFVPKPYSFEELTRFLRVRLAS